MKKLFIAILLLLFVSLCACGQATSKEFAPYNSILRKHYISSKLWGVHYDGVKYYVLYDLNKDGAKELILGAEQGAEIGVLDIYTIHNNKAVFQDITIWNRRSPPPLLFENGTIKFVDNEMNWISYYRFEDGELKLQICLFDNVAYQQWLSLGGWEDENRYLNSIIDPFDPEKEDMPLAKEEFEQLQKDMEGNGQVVELDWKPLAKYRQ